MVTIKDGPKKKKRGVTAPSQANLYGGQLRPTRKKQRAQSPKKPNVINYGGQKQGLRGALKSLFKRKGRKTSASCRGGNCW